jgi:predicted mannosyl-3-phosphoglycerate phosphatase (HAD superfamily)
MQTSTLTPSAPLPVLTSPPCAGVSLVIFSAVDDVLTDPGAIEGIRFLTGHEVPLVLVSERPAADLLALQQAHGVAHPFVCDGGAALYLPAGYFPELTRIGTCRDGWNVVEFRSRHPEPAVRFLVSLFRLCSEKAVIVGLAGSEDDRALLHEVDVPCVVDGVPGWSEAILGSLAE